MCELTANTTMAYIENKTPNAQPYNPIHFIIPEKVEDSEICTNPRQGSVDSEDMIITADERNFDYMINDNVNITLPSEFKNELNDFYSIEKNNPNTAQNTPKYVI